MSYKERHHKLIPTITCEAWSEDHSTVFMIRLKVTPNERESFISSSVISDQGNWDVLADGSCIIRLKPGRWDVANLGTPLYPVNFKRVNDSFFQSVTKKQLPGLTIKKLRESFKLTDWELLEKDDIERRYMEV